MMPVSLTNVVRLCCMQALAIALMLLFVLPSNAPAQVSRTLSYQGMLADSLGNPKPDGTYSFTFRLYQVASGGSALWTEVKTLTVKRGLFQTVLGDQVLLSSGLVFDRPYWLSVQVAAEPELSPRALLTPVGYSQRAAVADTAKYALSTPIQAAVDSARIAGQVALPFVGTISTPGYPGFSVTSAGTAFYGVSSGSMGVWGISQTISGAGVIGDNTFGEAVVGRNRGGNGVGAVVGRNDSAGYGVRGFNTKGGIGVLGQAGVAGGTGVGGRFENVNAASPSNALEVATNGTGHAALFTAGSGSGSSSNAALHVENFKSAGEGIVARKAVAANTDPVMLLLEDPSSTGNFLNGSFMNSGGTVTGKFHITSAGTYVAGSDFAESFEAVGGLDQYEPGDVVVLASSSPCAVEKTSTPYDTRVAGVYSTRPGILGSDKDGVTRVDLNDMPVAVIGIVPTKVSAENGAILPGDLLTCSSTPGYAMKASPIMINGIAIYPTGTIIGKALDALPSAQGVIKVLVNLK